MFSKTFFPLSHASEYTVSLSWHEHIDKKIGSLYLSHFCFFSKIYLPEQKGIQLRTEGVIK